MRGWTKVETDDVRQFLGESLVTYFEGFYQMGFETMMVPDATHAAFAAAGGGCHSAGTPMSGIERSSRSRWCARSGLRERSWRRRGWSIC